jgi:hypothetical protein
VGGYCLTVWLRSIFWLRSTEEPAREHREDRQAVGHPTAFV